MLRNIWYIAARADEIADTPLTRTILGQDLVLFRDSGGTAHAMDDYCPHRGARLSDGSINNDRIVCPFHGWELGTDGICRHIPANGPGVPIPLKARTRVYPVQEADGFVWVYLGDPQKMPNRVTPPKELSHPAWRSVPFGFLWNAHFTRMMENLLDISHIPFVHPETVGPGVDATISGPVFRVDGTNLVIYPKRFAPDSPGNDTENVETEDSDSVTLIFPNIWMFRSVIHKGQCMATFVCLTPVDDDHTLAYGVVLRNFAQDASYMDDFHRQQAEFVFSQDQRIVERQRPKIVPFTLTDEIHVRADAPVVRYRLLLKNALKQEGSLA